MLFLYQRIAYRSILIDLIISPSFLPPFLFVFLLYAPKQCLFSSLSVLLHLQTAPCETSIYPARSSDGYNTLAYEIDIYE